MLRAGAIWQIRRTGKIWPVRLVMWQTRINFVRGVTACSKRRKRSSMDGGGTGKEMETAEHTFQFGFGNARAAVLDAHHDEAIVELQGPRPGHSQIRTET